MARLYIPSEETVNQRMKRLMKQGDNDKLESTIENHNIALSDPVDSWGNTLLHLAIKRKNVEFVKILLRRDSPVNAKNSSLQTPLMVAVRRDCAEGIRLLLEKKANINIRDLSGKTPLKIAIENKLSSVVFGYFNATLRESGATLAAMAALYKRLGCSLKQAYLMRDSELLVAILHLERLYDERECSRVIRNQMKLTDTQSIRDIIILTRYGRGNHYRERIFIDQLFYSIENLKPNEDYVRTWLNTLIELNGIAISLMNHFARMFRRATRNVVQLLFDCQVHTYFIRRFQRDVTIYLVANRKVDVKNFLENLDISPHFWTTRTSRRGNVLHLAVESNCLSNVEYLLDNAPNPRAILNIRDQEGRTPLYLAVNYECAELLLKRGANIQRITYDNLSVFVVNRYFYVRKYLIAYLCCFEGVALTITHQVADNIESNRRLKKYYDKFSIQVGLMKSIVLSGEVSLFAILTRTVEVTARCIRFSSVQLSDLKVYKPRLNWFYYTKSKTNLKKALIFNEMYRIAVDLIAESVNWLTYDNLTTAKIFSFLTYEDMLVFKDM